MRLLLASKGLESSRSPYENDLEAQLITSHVIQAFKMEQAAVLHVDISITVSMNIVAFTSPTEAVMLSCAVSSSLLQYYTTHSIRRIG